MERLSSREHLVGVKQCRRAIRNGQAELAFIANDVEDKVKLPLEALCREYSIPFETAPSMDELGKVCGITVGAAIAILTK